MTVATMKMVWTDMSLPWRVVGHWTQYERDFHIYREDDKPLGFTMSSPGVSVAANSILDSGAGESFGVDRLEFPLPERIKALSSSQ